MRRLKPFSNGLLVLFFLFVSILWPEPAVYASTPDETLFVSVQSGRITVKVTNTPFAKLLQTISKKADIKVYGDARMADERITIEFQDLPIEEGMGKILARYNFAYIFSQGETGQGVSSPHTPKEVWLFPRGDGMPSGQMESDKTHNFVQLSGEDLESPDLSIRLNAIDGLRERMDPKMVPVLINFLKDPDRAVRFEALDVLSEFDSVVPLDLLIEVALKHEDPETRRAAISSGFAIPRDVLKDHALHDPSPQVRVEALEALEGETGIEDIAKEALKDADASVQAIAKEILLMSEEENKDSQTESGDEDLQEDEE